MKKVSFIVRPTRTFFTAEAQRARRKANRYMPVKISGNRLFAAAPSMLSLKHWVLRALAASLDYDPGPLR